MVKCEICNDEFKNNLGGDLTKHILDVHNMKLEDYYVLTILKGVEPKCLCELCDDRPFFYRGKFSKYALNHHSFDWQKNKYIEINGIPICENPDCNNPVDFYRGKPRRFCSHKCSKINQPNYWNQEKVRKTVKEKYNVDNVFQLDSIKNKSIETNLLVYGVKFPIQNKDVMEKVKKTNNERYGVDFPFLSDMIKIKIVNSLLLKYNVTHISKTDEFREMASANMCKYNSDGFLNHKISFYKDTHLYYQSLYEYRFLEFCEENGYINDIDNSKRFTYLDSNKYHIPDFIYLNKYVIEIKSTYYLIKGGGWETINRKKNSVESEGYIYVLILDEKNNEFIEKCVLKLP